MVARQPVPQHCRHAASAPRPCACDAHTPGHSLRPASLHASGSWPQASRCPQPHNLVFTAPPLLPSSPSLPPAVLANSRAINFAGKRVIWESPADGSKINVSRTAVNCSAHTPLLCCASHWVPPALPTHPQAPACLARPRLLPFPATRGAVLTLLPYPPSPSLPTDCVQPHPCQPDLEPGGPRRRRRRHRECTWGCVGCVGLGGRAAWRHAWRHH